jgi:alcohol dehydrogenase class IV
MWFFNSPEIIFGPGALDYLEEVQGQRAFLVTDANIEALGFVDLVRQRLEKAGLECQVWAEVEPDPALQTVQRGAAAALAFEPDWIIGLGGGSCMDAAKGIWVLYERPDLTPDGINPIERLGLRQKARLIAIPTTSGTGAEATWAIVLTDTAEQRKLGLGSRENLPDMAIVDPLFTANLPPRLTADTGLDALAHAIEGYTNSWANDFCDGPCLKATELVFKYLRRAYTDGSDAEAREKMHNAATLAGMGFGNSMVALAHSMGHALGGIFHTPHGRAVALFLPYSIEFIARGPTMIPTRYGEIAHFLGLPAETEEQGAASLVAAIRDLMRQVEQPLTLQELGVGREELEANMETLATNAELDVYTITSLRVPTHDEIIRLYRCAYEGQSVDF